MADKAKAAKKPVANGAAKPALKSAQPQQPPPPQKTAHQKALNGKDNDEEIDGAVIKMLGSHERELLAVAFDLRTETRHYDNELRNLREKLESATRRLMQLEWRFPTSALWRIGNFLENFQESKNKGNILESPQYYLSRQGYKFCMYIALYGTGQARGKYISLYVSLCKGDFDGNLAWPFGMRLYLSILDQTDDQLPRRDFTKMIIPRVCKENSIFLGRPKRSKNSHFGLEKFASIDEFLHNGRNYVRNDAMFVRLEVPNEDLLPL